MVAQLHPGRAPAPGLQLPLAAGGRQPVRHLVDLRADPRARTQVGRLLSARRHRRAGARPGARCSSGSAARCGSNTPVERILTARRRASPACAPDAATRSLRRRRGQQRRRGAHLPGPARPRSARRRRRRRALERKRFSMSLFVIYFGTQRRHPHLAHHTVLFGPRYRELLDDIFDRGVAGRRLLALPARAHRVTDPVAGARRAAGVLRAGAGAAPGQARHRLDSRRPALRRPHPRLSRAALHSRPARRPRHQPHLHAARLPRDAQRPHGLGLLARAGADAERLVPPAQPRRRAARPVLRRRRHASRAPACPAWSARPRPPPG